jgi:hypothetical protein
MARLLFALLDVIFDPLKHASDFVPRLYGLTYYVIIRTVKLAVLPEVVFSFLITFVLVITICILIAIVHIVVIGVLRGRAVIFISYQHDQNGQAESIESELTRRSLRVIRLPFVASPEHYGLLDEIKHSIRRSDVFICIPGGQSSFVDDEVAIAFALDKPMLFVVAKSLHYFIPDTAKKGYPIFDLEQIQLDECAVLAAFCSYLAADQRSTVKLFLAYSII